MNFKAFLIKECKYEIERLKLIIPLQHLNDIKSVRGKLGFQKRLLKYLNKLP